MKRLFLALLFFAGGLAQEIRQPFSCHCVPVRARVILVSLRAPRS
jgi:hypothetical protein